MKKPRFLATTLATLLLISVFSFTLAFDPLYTSDDITLYYDLNSEALWADKEQLSGELKSDGLHVTMVQGGTHITVPLSLTVDVAKVSYLYMDITGVPAGKTWIWALDYTDKNGITGTIKSSDDYAISEGDWDGEFSLIGHFNYRNNQEGAGIDLSSITFKELRFFSSSDAGTQFVIKKFYIGSLNDGSEPIAPPANPGTTTTTTPAPKAPNTGDNTPIYFAMFAVALAAGVVVLMPRLKKSK